VRLLVSDRFLISDYWFKGFKLKNVLWVSLKGGASILQGYKRDKKIVVRFGRLVASFAIRRPARISEPKCWEFAVAESGRWLDPQIIFSVQKPGEP
jgi:hypothetical protein